MQDQVEQGIETEGSNLSGVNSRCSWDEPGENGEDYYNDDMKDHRPVDERRNSNEIDRPRISDFGKIKIGTTKYITKSAWTYIHRYSVYCMLSEN